jgi:hypothetical protein
LTARRKPAPHPYRRIRKDGAGFLLAVKEWRIRFHVDGSKVTVDDVRSGYRPSVVYSSDEPSLAVHRAFLDEFGSKR